MRGYTMTSKWFILTTRQAQLQKEADALDRDLRGMEHTPCGIPCVECGEILATEADFAKHFEVQDTRYLNLGWCPNVVR